MTPTPQVHRCIKPLCSDTCIDCAEAVPMGGGCNLDDLRRLRAEALAAGVGSGRWIKAATSMMDAFPHIYNTARAMNERQAVICSAAADVVDAFTKLGQTSDPAGLLLAKSRCEVVMLKLSEALKS